MKNTLPPEFMSRHLGRAALILGDGPSINGFDCNGDLVRLCITYGCNRIGRLFAPDYYVITDQNRLAHDGHLVTPASQLILYETSVLPPGAIHVCYDFGDILGPPTIGRIYHAQKSGNLMLHIAYQMGCRHFFIVGIDGYRYVGPKHFYETKESGSWDNREEQVQAHLTLFCEAVRAEDGWVYNLSQMSFFNPPPYCSMEKALELSRGIAYE